MQTQYTLKEEKQRKKILQSSDLTRGQRVIFDFIFSHDHIMVGFNNIQVNMLGQTEDVRQKIARLNAHSDILLVKNNRYPPGEIRDLCSQCLKKANLSFEEDIGEFWQFIEEYYVRALTFNYDEEKVKQTLVYDLKTLSLHSNLDRRDRYFGYTATQHLERIIGRYVDYSQEPDDQRMLQKIGYNFSALLQPALLVDVRQEVRQFDQEILGRHPLRSVPQTKLIAGLLVFAAMVASIYFGFNNPVLTVFMGGFGGFFVALIATEQAGNYVHRQNMANANFLEKEFDRQLELLKKSIVLIPAKYIDSQGEKNEVLVRNSIVPRIELPEIKQTPTTKPIKRRSSQATPIGQRPKMRPIIPAAIQEQKTSVIFFGGLTYDPRDTKCEVQQLQHPSGKLFGFLNTKVLREHKVDEKEIAEFKRVLDTGKILPADSKGQSGIKPLSTSYNPIWFFSWGTKKYVYGTTKIKIMSSGARVLGHRAKSVDERDSSALEIYDTYRTPKQAHR